MSKFSTSNNAIARPTSLIPVALSVPSSAAAPAELPLSRQPPQLSISPADSASKASSSDNLMSGLSALGSPEFSVHDPRHNQSLHHHHITASRQPPLSPSSLSVTYLQSPHLFNGNHGSTSFIFPPANPASLAPSPSHNSLNSSLVSSINDLTIETEQLERAIRHNDTRFVRRMLDLYHNKFLYSTNIRGSLFDKTSLDVKNLFGGNPPPERSSFSKGQMGYERKESGSTAEPGGESPAIFTNALHLAIESNAFDVTVLLLKFSFDPNEAGVTPFTSLDIWRRRSDSSYESTALAASCGVNGGSNTLHVHRANSVSTSREQLIPHSVRSASSHLLSPVGGLTVGGGGSTKDIHHFIRFSITSSPSSANSELSSIGRYSTPTKVIKIKSELPPSLSVVHYGGMEGDNPINYEDEYTRDTLYSLPPVFLATALNNAPILRELIKYGANVNASDRHGVTPLHLALCQERLSRSCVHILIQSGAKALIKNKLGVTPKDLLMIKGHELTDLQKQMVETAFQQLLPQEQATSSASNLSRQGTQTEYEDSSPSLGLLFGDANSTTNVESVRGRHSEQEQDENGEQTILYTAKSSTSIPNAGIAAATITAVPANNKSNFLKKLKVSGRSRKQGKSTDSSTLASGPDVYLCLEEISSDGPSHSSYQGRESIFETSSVCGDEKAQAADDGGDHLLSPPTQAAKVSLTSTLAMADRNHQQTNSCPKGSANKPTAGNTRRKSLGQVFGSITDSVAGHGGQNTAASGLSFILSSIKVGSGNKTKSTHCKDFQRQISKNGKESWLNKAELSLQVIIKMASNMECVPIIINTFQKHLSAIIRSIDRATVTSLDKLIATLLNRILQTIIEELCELDPLKRKDRKESPLDKYKKYQLASHLCPLLKTSIGCLRGGQSLQYTALLMINKIIDVLIVYGVCNVSFLESGQNVQSPDKEKKKSRGNLLQMDSKLSSHQTKSTGGVTERKRNKASNLFRTASPSSGSFKWITGKSRKENDVRSESKLSSVKTGRESSRRKEREFNGNNFAHAVGGSNSKKRTDQADRATSLLQILIEEGVDLLLNVLNNAITLHKRVTGSKQTCTPSHRWRHCTYHCLQILSARALLYSSQSNLATRKFVEDGPLKVLLSSLDSTHDPHLLCLVLQIVSTVAIDPTFHSHLVDTDIADVLMQLILPSDEWFYTNHSTKYARYVKHHAARVLVYLGLEKRLRNKVHLFDLLEDTGPSLTTPSLESEEDLFIVRSSVSPVCVRSGTGEQVKGISLEGMVLEMLSQIEKRIVTGDSDGEGCDGGDLMRYKALRMAPPAIQVDLVSSKESSLNTKSALSEDSEQLSPLFYLSTFPMALHPLIMLRLLQHRMLGSVLWPMPSNAVSRSSVASSYGENRSRASSTAGSNIEEPPLRARRNVSLTIACPGGAGGGFSPSKVDIDRRASLKNALCEERLMGHAFINFAQGPLKGRPSIDKSATDRNFDSRHETPVTSPTASSGKKAFRLSSFKRKCSKSAEKSSPPLAHHHQQQQHHHHHHHHHLESSSSNPTQADILAFQRELQNIPRNETSPVPIRNFPSTVTAYSSVLSSYIREALERSLSPAVSRPRSCSVPRTTYGEGPQLQPPTYHQYRGSGSGFQLLSLPQVRNTVCESQFSCNLTTRSPSSLSPNGGRSHLPYGESPASSASGKSGHHREDAIIPNTHRAVFKLLMDWIRMAPSDLRNSTAAIRELNDFLGKLSTWGEQYQWRADEIRIVADLQDVNFTGECNNEEALIHEEYLMLQQLVLSGTLPCSKEEASVLAGIQLRIEETSPTAKPTPRMNSISAASVSGNERQSSVIGYKLRPICEDAKETSPGEYPVDTRFHAKPNTGFFSSYDNEEDDVTEAICRPGAGSIYSAPSAARENYRRAIEGSSNTRKSFFVNAMGGMTRRTTSVFRNLVTNSLTSDERYSSGTTINLRECLPPMYHNTKGMAKAIKEQKRKLFHTQIYESEIQLKKLYLQTCKRLPAYGCQTFQVKEILRGKTKRRVTRLLGLGLEKIFLLDSKTLTLAKFQKTRDLQQWRTGGGRSHDRLILEFRATKWAVATTSSLSLRAIGNALWGIMQDIDGQFLSHLLVIQPEYLADTSNETRPGLNLFPRSGVSLPAMHHREELESLQSILHFPEEVALRLSEVEYELFYGVPPLDYIRHITVNVSANENSASFDYAALRHACHGYDANVDLGHSGGASGKTCTVQHLVKRFNEVSSWITHLIISQPTHDDRKAVLSCIIRTAQSAWNLGSFNTALEIIAGLKSDKLRPFWLSIKESETPLQVETLTRALLFTNKPTPEYREAIKRALNIPQSKVIPFFGNFLKDLYTIFNNMPSLVVLPSSQYAQTVDGSSSKDKGVKLEFISDFQGEDHFLSRIGTGGIINMDKMKKAQQVLENVRAFHLHAQRRRNLIRERVKSTLSMHTSETELDADPKESINHKDENEDLYEIDSKSYVPIQPIHNDHGVSYVPINSDAIDLQILQTMHHGCTVIHIEEDTGRSACVYLKLEISNGLLAWCKPTWSGLKTSANASMDYNLSVDIEETILPSVIMKHDSKEIAVAGLEEGFIDLLYVKDVYSQSSSVDYSAICRRYGLQSELEGRCCVSLLYGANLSDNRVFQFLMPKVMYMVWSEGLRTICVCLKMQKSLSDQRILWLKSKYLQLYYDNGVCVGPTPAEAIQVFGGRKWTLEAVGGSVQSSLDVAPKRTSSFGIATCKLRKKKSTASLTAVRDSSPRSQASIASDASPQTVHRLNQSPTGKQKGTTMLSKVMNAKLNADIPLYSSRDISPFSPHGSISSTSSSSSDNSRGLPLDSPQIHTSSLISAFQEKLRTNQSNEPSGPGTASQTSSIKLKPAITHSSQMNFVEFMELFRAFLIRSRKDIKELFEKLASKSDIHSLSEKPLDTEDSKQSNKLLGLLTQNFPFSGSEISHQRYRICDAIAAASIVTNSAGVDTLRGLLLTEDDFQSFLRSHQGEDLSPAEVRKIIRKHEPNIVLRQRSCLSFEGFACYLMDKDNYAFTPERLTYSEDDMNEPLSHYYIAASHNTYLTGHQLKGESSVELYSQVLLAGCRCVELDCWDGDDGMPVIYHGHTLTSKIPFKKVVETINEKAFVASPFPVILSIENHCSLQQQVKMAQTFISVFGEKLVTKFLFEADFSDDPQLPSPRQLKYRILIKNKKLRAAIQPTIALKVKNLSSSRFQSHRTNSLVSAASTGSLNEDEDDYDEDDDDDEQVDENLPQAALPDQQPMTKPVALRTESSSSQEGGSSAGDIKFWGGRSRNETPEVCEEAPPKLAYISHPKVVRKSSSQVAPELSDLVIYCQAIKFRGFSIESASSPTNAPTLTAQTGKKTTVKKSVLSPNPSYQGSGSNTATTPVSAEFLLPGSISSAMPTASPTTAPPSLSFNTTQRRPCVSANCYQVASLNEHSAKKLCRKHPLAVIAHTESQLMRSYPAGMRIDSSNFNPVIFWAFGVQLVALNFQTEDAALAINKAMFEQNGLQGYVLKPRVMWDKSHMMYGRFNPWDKEFDGLYAIDLTVQVLSGQYVCQENHCASTQVEVEIIGIPVDCNKQRSKIQSRNSINPNYDSTFVFRITFVDLAFIRFAVYDTSTNHVVSQRVVPVKALKQGYRHLRLKSSTNQPLPLSSLFIYTSSQEEGMEVNPENNPPGAESASQGEVQVDRKASCKTDFTRLDTRDIIGSAPVRRRMFFLVVHGVFPDEPSTILKITQESTTLDVINQALAKANKVNENVCDYVLIEEVGRSWDKRQLLERNTTTQRILEPTERPLEAQSKWKGEGRFVLKKVADDPSSRAWMSTIKAASMQKEKQLKRQDSDGFDEFNSWTDEKLENFLVCVYNVSQDQPYAILKASVSSTAQDIISQALLKARRMEDPKNFVLLEELSIGERTPAASELSMSKHRDSTSFESKRILDDNENVYLAQASWKGKGLFRLVRRDEICTADIKSSPESSRSSNALSKLTRTAKGSLKKLNKLSKISSPKSKEPSADLRSSDAEFQRNHSSFPSSSFHTSSHRIQGHPECETEGFFSDTEDSKFMNISFARLKRLSIRKLRVWR